MNQEIDSIIESKEFVVVHHPNRMNISYSEAGFVGLLEVKNGELTFYTTHHLTDMDLFEFVNLEIFYSILVEANNELDIQTPKLNNNFTQKVVDDCEVLFEKLEDFFEQLSCKELTFIAAE